MLNKDLIEEIKEINELFTIKLIFNTSDLDSNKNEAINLIYSLLEKTIGSKNAAQSIIEELETRLYWKKTDWSEVFIHLALQEECSPEDIFESVLGKKSTDLYYGYDVTDELQEPRLVEELIIVPSNLKNIKWIYVYNGADEPGFPLSPEDWLETVKYFKEEHKNLADNLADNLEDNLEEPELLPLTIVENNIGFVDEQEIIWCKGPSLNQDDIFEWDLWLPENIRDSMKELSKDGIHMSVKEDGEASN